METISVRFEKDFVQDMKKVMKGHRYATTTEFIRGAVREKIVDLEKQEALFRLERAYGAGMEKGRHITDKDIHRVGKEAVSELAKKLGAK